MPGQPSLRISFSRGERPYLFWVSHWTVAPVGRARYKILSKKFEDKTIEVLVIQESQGRRDTVAQVTLPNDLPSGWISRWVDILSGDLKTQFEVFDLRSIQTAEEWRDIAARLGWSAGRQSESHAS